ncbi:MAG: hypothetical protein Q7J06_06040 [Bacteroidales bacterium]|nr:hypothetical protein [Bacteroidales bacterium]
MLVTTALGTTQFYGDIGGFSKGDNLLGLKNFYGFTGFVGLSFKVKPNDILSPKATATKGFTPVIPVGVGVNVFFSSYICFGAELSGRFTFSDDIDGYSSTYSKSNDLYQFLNFTFTYKIKTGENGLPSF